MYDTFNLHQGLVHFSSSFQEEFIILHEPLLSQTRQICSFFCYLYQGEISLQLNLIVEPPTGFVSFPYVTPGRVTFCPDLVSEGNV